MNTALLDVLGRVQVLCANRPGLLEVATLLLRSQSSGAHNAHDDDGSRNAHDGAVGRRLGALGGRDHSGFSNGVDDLGGR